MRARLEPAFLEGFHGGRRFALWVRPPETRRDVGAILCLQPFGEEANLSRRVLVAQALRLAERGWTTLLLDPFGTGDSDGSSDEATMQHWRADLLRASHLVREKASGPFVLWGTRLGALLAAELAIALDQLVSAMVFWQPAGTGAQFIDPLLKLAKLGAAAREAASSGAAARPSSPSGRDVGVPPEAEQVRTLPSGSGTAPALVDVAGYRLRRDLLDALGGLAMQAPALGEHSAPCPVLILGVQRVLVPGSPAPRPLSQLAQRWLDEGYLASLRVVQGEPFWASLEPSVPAAAFEATETFLEALDEGD